MYNRLDHSQKRNALKKLRFLSFQYSKLKNQDHVNRSVLQIITIKIRSLLSYLRNRVSATVIRKAIGVSLYSVLISTMGISQNFTLPKALEQVAAPQVFIPDLIDYDDDGDLDAFGIGLNNDLELDVVYLENGGTAEMPIFTEPDFDLIELDSLDPYGVFLEAADMDNDGDLDVLSISFDYDGDYSALLSFHENLGDGEFATVEKTKIAEFNDVYYTTDLSIIDFDNDGDYDILTFGYDPSLYDPQTEIYNLSLYYFENVGTPEDFSFTELVTNPNNFPPVQVDEEVDLIQIESADYDNDGDIDLIMSPLFDYEDTLSIIKYIENTPDGFARSVDLELEGITGYLLMTSGDIDGDGDVDILYERYAPDSDPVNSDLFWLENTTVLSTVDNPTLKAKLNIIQNPTIDQLTFEYQFEDTSNPVTLKVISSEGIEFKTERLVLDLESGIKSININDLNPGTYFLNVVQGKTQNSLSFIKM